MAELEAALDDPVSMRARSLAGFSSLLAARGQSPAFASDSPRRVLSGNGPVFALERGSGSGRVLVLVNCGREKVDYTLPAGWAKATKFTDPCSGSETRADGTVALPGYCVRWLEF